MKWKDHLNDGMMYIGRRPTTHPQGELQLEVHLFDWDGELYGEQAWVDVLKFIRDDMNFASHTDLLKQIRQDQVTIKAFLAQIQ
jgi:FAD synthase